ncbi:hypothetical protein KFL_005980080 [Klebsormidium nitens]|uniref:RRM domain-containing protein n=1 Tax=Klebsormidium nitens TaxID=105231 RepID=A0A1Y1IHE3_KLENI|nr:hypothetical protein KFL_005980080 [Klebsormidium nitens]|eukprot:GAQ90093.1 hypothetical protein KFL_005980080 [Klebsormidium nitens]
MQRSIRGHCDHSLVDREEGIRMETERQMKGSQMGLGMKREREQHANNGSAAQRDTDTNFWMREDYGPQDSSSDVSDSADDVDLDEPEEGQGEVAEDVPETLNNLLSESHIHRTSRRNQRKKPRVTKTEEDGRSVFVGRLPANATSQVLRNRFTEFGHVAGVEVRSFKTKKGQRTYAYIEFADPQAAARALKASPIRVKGMKVYVGSIRRREPPQQGSRKGYDQAKGIAKPSPTLNFAETGLPAKLETHPTASTEIFIEDGANAPATRVLATGGEITGRIALESAPFPNVPFPPKPPASEAARFNVPVDFDRSEKLPDQIETEPMSPTFPGRRSSAIHEKKAPSLSTVPEITPLEEEDKEEVLPADAAHAAARTSLKACAIAKPEPKPVNPNAKPGPARFKLVELQDGSFTVLAPRGGTADAVADVIDIPVKGAREHEPGADMEVVPAPQEAQPGAARGAALSTLDQTHLPNDVIASLETTKSRPKSANYVSASAQAIDGVSPNPETLPDAAMGDGSDDDMPPLENIPDARPAAADVMVLPGKRAAFVGGENAFEIGATSAAGARSHRRNKRGKEAEERPPRVPYYRNYSRPRKAPIYTHMVVAAFAFFRERVAAAGGRELARELLEWLVSPEVLETASRDPSALQLLFGDTRWIATGLTGLPPPERNAQLEQLEERYRRSTDERVTIDKVHRDSFAERVERFCALCGVDRYKDPVWSFTGGV